MHGVLLQHLLLQKLPVKGKVGKAMNNFSVDNSREVGVSGNLAVLTRPTPFLSETFLVRGYAWCRYY